MSTGFWLTNVRLEQGYRYEDGRVTATETAICHLRVEDGKIAEVISGSSLLEDGLTQIDAGNLLALPPFVESHCHLDKTLVGTAWRARVPTANIFGRFDVEKKVLPTLPLSTSERATALLEIMRRAGSTHIRTHVDVYPEAGLSNLEGVQHALAAFDGKLTHEIVAFPQHGLLLSKSANLVREAVRQGATHVGGVDPANVDGNIEASLQQTMEIAVAENAGVDLHLHDPGHLGAFTIRRLAALTVEAGWQGRVAVSHAFSLGDLPSGEAAEMAEMLAEAGIAIITHVPIDGSMPPVELLHGKGVQVAVGSDNIFDTWQVWGNGDLLERAGRLAERRRWSDELSLAQALGYITGGKTPLDNQGNRVWPRVGDEASLVLVHASCSAEAVARTATRQAVIFRGKLVAGNLG